LFKVTNDFKFNKTNLWLWRFSTIVMSIFCFIFIVPTVLKGYWFTCLLMITGTYFCWFAFVNSFKKQDQPISNRYDQELEIQERRKDFKMIRWDQ